METVVRMPAPNSPEWVHSLDPGGVFALSGRAGWGYFDPGQGAGGRIAFGDYVEGYQNPPINWGINTARKTAFFETLRAVTGG